VCVCMTYIVYVELGVCVCLYDIHCVCGARSVCVCMMYIVYVELGVCVCVCLYDIHCVGVHEPPTVAKECPTLILYAKHVE